MSRTGFVLVALLSLPANALAGERFIGDVSGGPVRHWFYRSIDSARTQMVIDGARAPSSTISAAQGQLLTMQAADGWNNVPCTTVKLVAAPGAAVTGFNANGATEITFADPQGVLSGGTLAAT